MTIRIIPLILVVALLGCQNDTGKVKQVKEEKPVEKTEVAEAPVEESEAAVEVQIPDGVPVDLSINPRYITLGIGQVSPALEVTAFTSNPKGLYPVSTSTLRSLDSTIVAREEPFKGRFVGRKIGRTQIQASFRGATAIADVAVTTERFLDIEYETSLGTGGGQIRVNISTPALEDLIEYETSPGMDTFQVKLNISAPASEGPLEYRVYASTATPTDKWVACQMEGERQTAVLVSDPVPIQAGTGHRYHRTYEIVVEARDKSGDVQQHRFPLVYHASPIHIERIDPP